MHEVLHVGRHPFCDFCIQEDPAVSFHHLRIRRNAKTRYDMDVFGVTAGACSSDGLMTSI